VIGPRRAVGRALLVVVVYLLAWTALDVAASQFQAARDVSLWYPPPALDLVLLLVFGLRYTPALLVNTIIHTVLVNPVGLDALPVAAFDLATTAGYAGAALVLLRGVRIDPRLPTQRDVLWLVVVACGAGPILVAAAQVALLCTAGVLRWSQLPLLVAGYWAGSATGVAMLAPVLLLAARRWPAARPGWWTGWPEPWVSRPPLSAGPPGLRVSPAELAAQLLVLAATLYAAYASTAGASMDYTYLVYAPLVWIAVRGGLRLAAPAVLLANIGAVALNGGRVPGQGGIALQFGLVTLSLTGLLLGALITQRRTDSERHRHEALHDPLTGLANRALFTDRLTQAAARARRGPTRRFAVLLAGLDNFKQVNDSLGQHAGDQILLDVASRLHEATGPVDSLARLGGDEFAVLVEKLADPAEVEDISGRLLAVIDAPHQLAELPAPVVVSASIGSVLSRPDDSGGQELLRDATMALHRAKRDGRRRHVSFDRGMHQQAVSGLQRESALRQALHDQQISLAFQPVIDLTNLGVVGVEALARWTPPGGQSIQPATFIALAERTGLILPLGEQVLRQACQTAAGWQPDDGPPPRLAVNASPQELAAPGYTSRLLTVLADAGLPPSQLDIEITETQWVGQSTLARNTLSELAAAGVGLLVDDFGTGYSSFTYLHELPITGLKIDQSFIAGVPHHRQHAAIVRSILAMAAELDLSVTAEGVETPDQLTFLQQQHCPQGQGFLLGRPAAAPSPRRPAS